jgi:hypothetical protein
MAMITENISNVTAAITAKLAQIPELVFSVENQQRANQAVGGRILVRHQAHPEFTAGAVWIGSTALDSRGSKRTSQPQVYYDNLLELKTDVYLPPRYMFKWLEHGSTMEPSYRQSKPDAKVRADSLADTVAKWAEVLVGLVPEYQVESAAQKVEREQALLAREEAKRVEELRARLEQARVEARVKAIDDAKTSLVQDYGEFLYDQESRYRYDEDPVARAQRTRVQAGAGFLIKSTDRRASDAREDDPRPWFKLDGDYCKGFSVGELRAMMEALRTYRATTPPEEWLPAQNPEEPEVQVEAESEEPEESGTTELSAAIMLSVPLPDSMDD